MRRLVPALLALATAACSGSCAPKAALRGLPLEGALTAPAGTATFDHSDWATVLAASVDQGAGRVDYDAVPVDALDRYLAALAQAELAPLTAGAREALLINAYNAFTVKLIVAATPRPASIRDLDDPWGAARWTLAGTAVSLDDIEHGLLRPIYRDPRLHFALNCASIGCPPLRAAPWEGPGLDAQLTTAVREALAQPRHLQLDGQGLKATQLLDWYGADMTAPDWSPRADSLPEWLARYGPPEVAALVAEQGPTTRIRTLDYDWRLNQVAPAP